MSKKQVDFTEVRTHLEGLRSELDARRAALPALVQRAFLRDDLPEAGRLAGEIAGLPAARKELEALIQRAAYAALLAAQEAARPRDAEIDAKLAALNEERSAVRKRRMAATGDLRRQLNDELEDLAGEITRLQNEKSNVFGPGTTRAIAEWNAAGVTPLRAEELP